MRNRSPLHACVRFEDGTQQIINFEPVLESELYGPLRDLALFNHVRIDSEAHTLVWPNGADFDPANLHDWPEYEREFRELARYWATVQAQNPQFSSSS
ncbi:MAG: DUF2442 domain-containing protein [Acidobacteriaceae bacterium]|nr:DUF2442 domain-containing protein [Acidobacteriaceae bacterium]